jgi:hypothetical protein
VNAEWLDEAVVGLTMLVVVGALFLVALESCLR